ncbi:hypothetical protein, partial [Salmonella enterica]|uniref:hypothetical protein n=1 Tax=Salmonella enterica TaxID=28901 RepID=UPI003D2C6DBA
LQPDDRQAKWSNGYEYRVSGLPTQARPMGMIRVEVLKNGQPVQTIEPFLGAGAHGVILNQDASRFVHVHPGSQPVNGRYRS